MKKVIKYFTVFLSLLLVFSVNTNAKAETIYINLDDLEYKENNNRTSC